MLMGENRAAILFAHIRALERHQEAIDDARGDFNERKAKAKEDGFDTNVIAAILKRRKNGDGQTKAFDELLAEYEMGVREQEARAAQDNLEFDDSLDGISDAGCT